MPEFVYNPQKLTQELLDAKLPVAGVSSTGRISFIRDLTKSEQIKANDIINTHDPEISTFETRMDAFKQAGITAEDLLLALWDQVIEGDSSAATALKTKLDLIDPIIN